MVTVTASATSTTGTLSTTTPRSGGDTTAKGDHNNNNKIISSPPPSTGSVLQTPVPLNSEEEASEEVQALARALAPTLLAVDEVLRVPSEFASTRKDSAISFDNYTNDDDDLDDEMEALRNSELELRNELNLAQNFSNLFKYTDELYDWEDDNNNNNDFNNDDNNNRTDNDTFYDSIQKQIHITTPDKLVVHQSNDWKQHDTSIDNSTADNDYDEGILQKNNSMIEEAADDNNENNTQLQQQQQQQQKQQQVLLDDSMISNETINDKELRPIPIPKTPDDEKRSSAAAATTAKKFIQRAPPNRSNSESLFATIPSSSSYNKNNNNNNHNHSIIQYSASDHAEYLNIQKPQNNVEINSSWYTVIHKNILFNSYDDITEYLISVPHFKLKQLYVGFPSKENRNKQQRKNNNIISNNNDNSTSVDDLEAAADVMTTTTTTDQSNNNNIEKQQSSPHSPKNKTESPQQQKSSSPTAKHQNIQQQQQQQQRLPVRTLTIRIRPDVLCGAVMDAVHHSIMNIENAQIIKRQGGHCQAYIHGAFYNGDNDYDGNDETPPKESYPPFWVDIRLATYKSDEYERTLVVRVYHEEQQKQKQHENNNNENENETTSGDDDDIDIEPSTSLVSPEQELIEPIDETAALHLRESVALIQRIESPQSSSHHNNKLIHPHHIKNNNGNVQQVVTKHLLDHYRACPSVKTGHITLPALNAEDYNIIKSSWRFISILWDEIESRDLSYSTLRTSPFGAFPALPTLDVQYCSQLRRISRDIMTTQLIKNAKELEDYAHEAELACANLITLLKPTFITYNVEDPPLPKAKQLTEYPLDYILPQESCPPWGEKVQHALNEIQAWTSDVNKNCSPPVSPISTEQQMENDDDDDDDNDNKSFIMARMSVQGVMEAFQKQDDEEYSARLCRKNIQVMDRLSKMQSHQILSIQILQNAASYSHKARKAVQDFEKKSGGIREVPLLKWSIIVGKSTGTCTITANYILFVTQLIPVIGGYTKTLYKLDDVDFIMSDETASSLLINPLVPTIIIRVMKHNNNKEVYNFRPSNGGTRLKSFLDVLKSVIISIDKPLDIPR